MSNTSVIIVAAGKGKRMNISVNKQFIDISGKPLIARTIEKFQNLKFINEIIVVVGEDEIDYCKKNIIERYNFTKVSKIIAGGSERQESVYNGIKNVNSSSEIIMIHDGARPFIPDDIVYNAIEETKKNDATVVAVPVKDTIKIVSEKGFIEKTLDRSVIWSMQTPQTFKKDLIVMAHEKALKNNFLGTDDSVLAEQVGYQVKIVKGSFLNIKITTQEDLITAEAIIKNLNLD